MEIKRILEKINEYFPAITAMQGDRIGLQVQSGRDQVGKLLISMEVNDEVIDEAIENDCQMIIAFHPLIFMPLTYIDDSNRVGFLLTKLIQNKIALITIHTNFDSYINGTSRILSDKLGLIYDSFLLPDKQLQNYGMGVLSHFEEQISSDEFLEKVKNLCNSPIRYNKGKSDKIKNVAIVGGSGTSFLNEAFSCKADAFITSDITYHKFHEANGKLMLVDPGHYEMEQFVPEGLLEFFKCNFKKEDYEKIILSKVRTNPVYYYPNGDNYEKEQNKYLINNYKWI
jgi:dinuclear metal center YbgI/SA1388 family protein